MTVAAISAAAAASAGVASTAARGRVCSGSSAGSGSGPAAKRTLSTPSRDAIWAFELGQRAAEIAARLGVRQLRFVAGPLPGQAEEAEHTRPKPPLEASPEERAAAAEIAASVDDEELRERIARAVAAGLARARSDRSF